MQEKTKNSLKNTFVRAAICLAGAGAGAKVMQSCQKRAAERQAVIQQIDTLESQIGQPRATAQAAFLPPKAP